MCLSAVSCRCVWGRQVRDHRVTTQHSSSAKSKANIYSHRSPWRRISCTSLFTLSIRHPGPALFVLNDGYGCPYTLLWFQECPPLSHNPGCASDLFEWLLLQHVSGKLTGTHVSVLPVRGKMRCWNEPLESGCYIYTKHIIKHRRISFTDARGLCKNDWTKYH